MSIVSISELRRALQNQSRDVEIMRCIARMRSPNVSNIAEELGIDRKSARYHLYKLKGEGCVRDLWVRSTMASDFPISCHEWQLTERGWRLLRGGGLIFQMPVPGNLSFARRSPLCSCVDREVMRAESDSAQSQSARIYDYANSALG